MGVNPHRPLGQQAEGLPVADLYLYPNTIQAVVITGQDVQNWLDRSAGIFNQIDPGARRTSS